MMWWENGSWNGGSWLPMTFMMIGMVLFWAAVIALGVWGVRTARGGRRSPSTATTGSATRTDAADPAPTPGEALLAERFARGEIDEAQFTRTRALLHASPGAGRDT